MAVWLLEIPRASEGLHLYAFACLWVLISMSLTVCTCRVCVHEHACTLVSAAMFAWLNVSPGARVSWMFLCVRWFVTL